MIGALEERQFGEMGASSGCHAREESATMHPRERRILLDLVGPATPEELSAVDCFFGRRLAVFVPVLGPCLYALRPDHVHPGFMAILSRELVEIPGLDDSPGPEGLQLRILPPMFAHRERARAETPQYHAILLEAGWFSRILSLHGIPPDSLRWEPHAAAPRLLRLVRDFMRESGDGAPDDLLDALATVLAHEIARTAKPTPAARDEERGSIRAILEELERRFAEPHDLPGLARTACMSESTFLRRFREATGTSPMQFLLGIRIRRARQMLRAGRSVSDTAMRTGFSSPSHLSEAFRKRTGLSPLQFRRQFLTRS